MFTHFGDFVITTLFYQLELLPVAYIVILMYVVAAGVVGRLLGPMLLEHTSGRLRGTLAREMPVTLTGDYFVAGVLEKRALSQLNRLLPFILPGFNGCTGGYVLCRTNPETVALRKILLPERYWSGCPPRAAA